MTQWIRENGELWGPWVIHDGKGCPLKPGVIAEVVAQDRFGFAMRTIATIEGGSYSSWNWEFYPELKKIIRYREKKPKGLQILETRMQEKDAPVPPQRKTAPKHTSPQL